MGSNQVKALGFSAETVITEDLLEKLWNKYNKEGYLKHDAATNLLRDLLKVYNLPFNKPAVKTWLANSGLPPGGQVDRAKFASLFLTRAREEKITMSDVLTLEAEVQSKGALYFGIPLETSWKRVRDSGEAHISTKMIDSLRRRALHEEGLFRLAGNKAEVRFLHLQADCGKPIDFDHIPVHDTSSLLKIFYRELPEPIIPFDSYDAVVGASRSTDDDDHDGLLAKLRQFVSSLPEVNKMFLHELFEFMNEVASHADTNKMSLRNLVIVWAPNLLRAKETSVEQTMADYNHVNRAIQTLVAEHATIFDSVSSLPHSSVASSPSSSASHSEPSPSSYVVEQATPAAAAASSTVADSSATNAAILAHPAKQQAIALWDFEGMDGSGLIVRSGDVVDVLLDEGGEWLYCRKDDLAGYIPRNYVDMSLT